MSAPKTTLRSCRHKRAYSSEKRALQALSDLHAAFPGQARAERRVYPCNWKRDGVQHWHLTSKPVKGGQDAETLRYIATLERTVVFLLGKIEDRDRDLERALTHV